jgi:adenine-specific DNA-methyltransferase
VQLPEKTDKDSDAYKAGYKTIADIAKERIRRAGKKIKTEFHKKYQTELDKLYGSDQLKLDNGTSKKKELDDKIDHIKYLDTGFRVYKTDSSNMKDVFHHPGVLVQEQLTVLENNIKEDRTAEDLLIQVILDLGLELSLPIEKREIFGNTLFIVQYDALVACFDEEINFEIVDEIAEIKPFKVVFRDACFKDDKDRINVEERFKRLSPETVITVL